MRKDTLFFGHIKIFLYFCSVKRIISIFIILFSISLSVIAEENWAYIDRRHEIRLGWGDQLFESLMWHNPTSIATTLPVDYRQTYHEDYQHCQHIWVEYQWRYLEWFSVGGMFDVSEVGWYDVTRNGTGQEVERSSRKDFYNLVLMPTIRFTYFHHPYMNIYSGLGFGIDINGGTEVNGAGHKTDIGAAVNVTAIGVSANYDRWFMAVDLGGMTALKSKNTVFMAVSRMINFSIGARF